MKKKSAKKVTMRQRLKRLLLCIIWVALCTACAARPNGTGSTAVLPEDATEITAEPIALRIGTEPLCIEEAEDNGQRSRTYQLEGQTLTMYRLENPSGGERMCSVRLQPQPGTVCVYDATREVWTDHTLTSGSYEGSAALVSLADGTSIFCDAPKGYARLENGVIQQVSRGTGLTVTQDRTGITCEWFAVEGDFCDCTLLVTDGPPEPQGNETHCGRIWASYTDIDEACWCFDGYYRAAPSNYVPSGDNCYYRCAAAYLVRLMYEQMENRPEAPLMAVGTLDTALRWQNSSGFWETSPQSEWLSTEYGIGAGFYDTRFNTDLMEVAYHISTALDSDYFFDILHRYGDYFIDFAEKHHVETENGGWLTADYGHPAATALSHTSLNHLAAEALTAYHLADLLDWQTLARTADRLVQAIRDTGAGWVKENHDLHYCIYSDGTFGREDYPLLTYNDLCALQEYLVNRTGSVDAVIQMLIREKEEFIANQP